MLMEKMQSKLSYERLIAFFPPKPILSEEDCLDAELIIEDLVKETTNSSLTPEQADYIYVISVLIADYKKSMIADTDNFVKSQLSSC
jgi:hypothetical protein